MFATEIARVKELKASLEVNKKSLDANDNARDVLIKDRSDMNKEIADLEAIIYA